MPIKTLLTRHALWSDHFLSNAIPFPFPWPRKDTGLGWRTKGVRLKRCETETHITLYKPIQVVGSGDISVYCYHLYISLSDINITVADCVYSRKCDDFTEDILFIAANVTILPRI